MRINKTPREKQIEQAGLQEFDADQTRMLAAFKLGAEWADENPGAMALEMRNLLEGMLHNNHISDKYSDQVYATIKKAGSDYKV